MIYGVSAKQTKNVNATINNSIHNSNNNDYNRYSKQII